MRRPLLRTLALALHLLLAGAGRAAAEDPKVIRIGTPGVGIGNRQFVGGSAFAALQGLGLLEEELKKDGVRVEWAFFKGAGPAVNEAVANGHLDVWVLGDLPAIVARAGGLKTKILAATTTGANTYVAVPPDSPIRRLEDLRGKRVAINKGTATHLAATRFLAAHGLSERDLRIVSMDAAAGKAALASGNVDAMIGALDLISLRNRGIARIVYSTRAESLGFLYQSALLTSDELIEKHPQLVQRVVSAWVRAARWVSEERRRTEVFELWARSGVPVETWREEFEGVSIKARASPLLDEFLVARLRAGVEDARRLGFIRGGFDVDGWIDRRFLDRALEAEGLKGFWSETSASGSPRPKGAKS